MAEKGGPKLDTEVYQHLEDDEVQGLYDTGQEKLKEAILTYQGDRGNTKHIKTINLLSGELKGLTEELEDRGLIEVEEEDDEQPSQQEDEYKEWASRNVPEKIGERQVAETNARMDTIRSADPEAKVRRNNFRDFDSMWKEVLADSKKVDLEKGRSIEKGELKEHGKAFKEGKVEKDYRNFGELYDEAHKDNEKVDKIRSGTEYKVRQSLKGFHGEIGLSINGLDESIKEYENSSWLNRKLNPIDRLHVANERFKVEMLDKLQSAMLTEQVKFAERKKELVERLDVLSKDNVEALSKMSERGGANDALREEHDSILAEMAILEEEHQETVAKIMDLLGELGVETSFKEPDGKLPEINSRELTVDEEVFREGQKEVMQNDPDMLAKMDGIGMRLGEHARVGSGVGFVDFFKGTTDREVQARNAAEHPEQEAELDKAIAREVETYKRKVLETRIKILRLTKMIEEEKKKDPHEMNLSLVNEAGERIRHESLELKKYGENLKQKVLLINHKSRLSGLISKISRSRVGEQV